MRHSILYPINAPEPVVYNTILDFKKFGKLHPYMKAVELIESNAEFSEYEIRESVLVLGFIPMKPHYTAKVYEIQKGEHIRYVSMVQNFIPLRIDFFLRKSDDGSISLVELIELKGNRLITGILMRMMKKTHAVIFEKLNASSNTEPGN